MAKKNPPPPAEITQAINLLKEQSKITNKSSMSRKQPTSRNHTCVTYILDADDLISILTRECVHHWAISPIHDKDVWTESDEKENAEHIAGTPKTPHRHVLVVFKDAKTKSACEKWFDRFSEELSHSKGVERFEHTKSQLCTDLCLQYRYQLHLDNADKYHYNASDRIVDQNVFWINVDSTDGQSADNLGRQMVDDIIGGATTYDMICTYGKEYIYHKKHLDAVVEQVKIDTGLAPKPLKLDDWLIDAYLKSANYDSKSIDLFHRMLEVVHIRYEHDQKHRIDNLFDVYVKGDNSNG